MIYCADAQGTGTPLPVGSRSGRSLALPLLARTPEAEHGSISRHRFLGFWDLSVELLPGSGNEPESHLCPVRIRAALPIDRPPLPPI